MPIRPDEFYRAAQDLSRMKPPLVSDEVCARTMVNRMYYAAYLATREALRVQFRNPALDVSHRTLAETLALAPDAEIRAIGSRLRVLKSAREESDYRPHAVVTKSDAALHLLNARFVLENVARLTGRYPRVRARWSV